MRVVVVACGLLLALAAPARAEGACRDGQRAVAEGRCCWPGQAWGEESQRCRGVPQCPAGLERAGEDCVARCGDGTEPTADHLHCCFAGQEWSHERAACIGVARCPEGYAATADEQSCVPAPRRPAGPPPCDQGCRDRAATDARLERRRAVWGPYEPFIGLGYLMTVRPDADVVAHGAELTLGAKLDGLPLLVYGDGSVSATSGGGGALGWSVNAGFAPWGVATPFLAAGVRGIYFERDDGNRDPALSAAFAPTLSAGYAFYVGSLSVPIAIVRVSAAPHDGGVTWFVSASSGIAAAMVLLH
jgi:hypothetical protein